MFNLTNRKIISNRKFWTFKKRKGILIIHHIFFLFGHKLYIEEIYKVIYCWQIMLFISQIWPYASGWTSVLRCDVACCRQPNRRYWNLIYDNCQCLFKLLWHRNNVAHNLRLHDKRRNHEAPKQSEATWD